MSLRQVKWCMLGLTVLYVIWAVISFIYPEITEGRSLTVRQIMFLASLPYVLGMWRLIKTGAKAWEKEQQDEQNKR